MHINSYTANNQQVLRDYATKIADKFNVQPKEEPNYFWSIVGPYLPSWSATGTTVGQAIAMTHGYEWSNGTIDFVMNKIFQEEVKDISWWSLEAVKNRVSGVAQQSFTEGVKLCLTPKAVPVLTAVCGVAGQVTLPLAITFISFLYSKTLGNSKELNKLGKLSLEELFSIDPETKRLRDGFENLLTFRDMSKIYQGTAEFHLVGQLIELCNEIDKIEEADKEAPAKELLKLLVDSYQIQRSDGKIVFPDGALKTEKEEEIIFEGLSALAGNNPSHDKKEIRKMIQVLSRHSVLPFQELSIEDLTGPVKVKKMPALFTGDNEWKNYIVRGQDGVFFMVKDCGDKKKGEVFEKPEMKVIFKEIDQLRRVEMAEIRNELELMMLDPAYRGAVIERLVNLDGDTVKAFLKQYVIERKDGQCVYLDGTFIEEESRDQLFQAIDSLPARSRLKDRKKALCEIVSQIGAHLPKDISGLYLICCEDGRCILRDGTELETDEAERVKGHAEIYFAEPQVVEIAETADEQKAQAAVEAESA
ncbi:MAG: hypothetical protein LW832_07890 [Parachlamydia sp.]|jgi:hypothetical protein|nr:hypothetical protein [Parachlamydia sp.]